MANPSRLVRSLLYLLFGVCPVLFFTDLTRNPYYTQITLLNIIVPALWLVWLFEGWRKGEFQMTFTAVDGPLLALVGCCLLSWSLSFIHHPALTSSLYSEGSRAAVFLIVNTYLVYAAALRVQDRALFRRLLLITYVVSVIASMYGIMQYFGTELIWPHNLNPYGSRPVSTFGNPNFLSSYLVLVIPVMIADLLFQVTGVPRVLLLAATLCNTAALLATLTRSSWLGLFVGVCILAAGFWRTLGSERRASLRPWTLAVGIGLALLVVFWPESQTKAYSASVISRLSEIKKITHEHYASAWQRYLIWTAAWDMVRDHPFLGKGWGCFELFYPFYQGPLLFHQAFQSFRTHANNAHNEIFEYWAQIGTIGLGLVFWLWIVFFRTASSVAKRLAESWRALAWGFIGGVAGMLADNMLNVSVHFAVPALLFWWWVGSALVLDGPSVQMRRWAIQTVPQKFVALLVGLCLVCFMGRAFCMWRQEVNFFKGFKLSKASGPALTEAQKALETAHAWHSLEVNNNYELGNVYARLGQSDKAVFMYQRALDANAGYDEIYFNRGTLLMQMGRTDDAIWHYRTCLAINPLSHDAYNAVAGLYFKDLPRYAADAENLYKKGLELFPQDKDMWNNLGYFYTERKQWEEAFKAYRQAVVIDPEFDLAKRNIGAILHHVPQHRSDPILQADLALREVARLMDAKRWAEALDQVRPLMAVLPRSYRVHFFAGNILFSLNRFEEAVAEYVQAVSLQPAGEGAWQNLGVTYDRLGQAQKADEAFQKVLSINPNNPAVKARLRL